MRKTSQDAGDCMSITSGLDFDIKKPGAGILKIKKTSIKRKVQNFSLESDDGVAEPLLQKEKIESGNQSAKFLLSKTKTDSTSDKGNEKDKLLADNKTENPSMTTSVPGTTDNQVFANGIKDSQITKSYASAAPIHNHMNANVFVSQYEAKNISTPKTQILVEIEGNKQKNYTPSPLIFTTAKIHTDGKTKALEPVHVTTVPILSTVEGSVVKTGLAKEKSQAIDILGPCKGDIASMNTSKPDASTTSSSKDHVSSENSISNVSVTFYSEILNKGAPSDKKFETSSTHQPPIVTELKTFKITSTQDKVMGNTVKSNDKIQTKETQPKFAEASSEKQSIKRTPTEIETKPASTNSTVSPAANQDKVIGNPVKSNDKIQTKETQPKFAEASSAKEPVKRALTEIETKPASINSTITPAVASISKLNKTSPISLQSNIPSDTREVKMDINKNIQALSSQKVERAKAFDTSVSDNVFSEDKTEKTTSNSISYNKQLQRQQNAKIDDKNVDSSKIPLKESKDLNNKLGSLNAIAQLKDEGTSVLSSTTSLPKSTKNNVVSSVHTSVSHISTKIANGTKLSSVTPKSADHTKPNKTSAPEATVVGRFSTVSSIKTSPLVITTISKPVSTKTVSGIESNIVKTLATGSNKLPTNTTVNSVKTATDLTASTVLTHTTKPLSHKPLKSNIVTTASKVETMVTPSLSQIDPSVLVTSNTVKTTEILKSALVTSSLLASNTPSSTGTSANILKTSTNVTVNSTPTTVFQTTSGIPTTERSFNALTSTTNLATNPDTSKITTAKPVVVSSVKTAVSSTISVKPTTSVNSASIPSKTPTMKASTYKASSIPKATLSKSIASTTGPTTTVTAKPSVNKKSEHQNIAGESDHSKA